MKLPANFADVNSHIPKLILTEVYPLTPFLLESDRLNVIDVGANTGLWCEAFFQVFGNYIAHYDAIEPMSGNLALLTARNRPINIFKGVAGDRDGEVEIHFDQEKTTLASVCNTQSVLSNRTVALSHSSSVKQVRLDSFYADRPDHVVDLLKIDVEGYEMEVIKGCQELMALRRINNIFFEFGVHNTSRGHSLKAAFELLSHHGFALYKATRGWNYFGLNRISRYDPALEPKERAVEMYLASLSGPSDAYRGPRVIGQIN